MGWTRRMPLGTITVLTAAFAWSLWCWTIGLPVLGAASTDCGTLHAGTRRWLCDAFSRPLSIDGTHQIPARVVVALLFLLIAVTLARTIMMNSRDGPIQLTDITLDDQGDGTARSPTARANSVDAIIRECLHRTGVGAHGVIPAYSGIDVRSSDVQGPPGYPTAMGLLTRVSVAWIQSGVFNLGWRVTITQTPASPPYRCGLTYSIQRAATGAIELTDSCWGSDVEDCARRVGYHLAAWRELRRSRNRSRLRGQLTSPEGMRLQDEALLEARHRRFDAAIAYAKDGLRAEPTNLYLRRVLGETYERLGLGLDALVVYASGLVFLDNVRNGWREERDVADPGDGTRSKPLRRARESNRYPRTRRDVDARGLLWRYASILHMCDTWGDVLIAESCRVDDRHRPRNGRGGDHPWFSERPVTGWDGVASAEDEMASRLREDGERTGLVRGFLIRRYHTLIHDEHALLHACWFVEKERRLLPFWKDHRLEEGSPDSPSLTQRIETAQKGVTLRRPWPRVPSRSVVDVESGRAALANLLCALDVLTDLQKLAEQSRDVDPFCAAAAALFSEVLSYVRARPVVGMAEVRDAVRSPTATAWEGLGLTRAVVAQVVSRLIVQLGALQTNHRSQCRNGVGSASKLDKVLHQQAELLGQVAASLDLKLALLRFAMDELDELSRNRGDARSLGPRPLVRLQSVMARHKYASRLLYIKEACSFRSPDDTGGDRDFHHVAASLEDATHLCIDAVASRRARALWRLRAAFHLPTWRHVKVWNLAYYAACAYAVTIPDYPGSVDGDASQFDDWELSPSTAGPVTQAGPRRTSKMSQKAHYDQWCRRYDSQALQAIRRLDEAITLRADAASSISANGVADWIVGEDPDLDLLRRHPRFRRWAGQHFQISLIPDWQSTSFGQMRAARHALGLAQVAGHGPQFVTLTRRNCLGALGSSVPWSREYVRWGLAHGHYLTTGLERTVPAAVVHLRALAQTLTVEKTQTGTAPHDAPDLYLMASVVGQELFRFWSCLPMYRMLSRSPDLRLDVSRILRGISGLDAHVMPGFPREHDVLRIARFLDYESLEAPLRALVSQAAPRADALRRLQPDDAGGPDIAALVRQTATDLARLLDIVEQALGPPPTHETYLKLLASPTDPRDT